MKFNYQFVHSKKQEILLFFCEFFFFIFQIFINISATLKLKKNLQNFFSKDLKVTILANGPSLESDLKKISPDDQVFAVNTFPINNNFNKFKPNFICWIDSMFQVDIEILSEPLRLSITRTFEQLNAIDWKLVLFIPKQAKEIISSRIFNKNISIVTIPSIKYDFESSFYLKLLSFLRLPPPRINVAVTAMYISIISGVKEIDLVGADMNRIHSFQVDNKTNTFQMNYVHFSNSNENKINFKDKLKNRKPASMYVKLKREASSFKWYAYIAMMANNLNISLRNKSSNSLIDSLER